MRVLFAIVTKRLLCTLLACTALPAAAGVINFDDIDASAADIPLAGLNPYQGFTWSNFSAYTSVPGFPGFNNGIVSSPNGAYTAGDALGSPIISSVSSGTPFDFISVELGAGWYDGMSVTLRGLLNGTQEFSRTVLVNTRGAQLFTFDFTGINELDIFSTVSAATTDPFGCGPSGCSQITLDDLTFAPSSGPPPPPFQAPEPNTIGLIGIAALALAARRHSR